MGFLKTLMKFSFNPCYQIKMSGVVFSHDPNTCSPYRVINWSDGPDTNLVTSGESGKIWFHAANSPYKAPAKLRIVVKLVEELLTLFDNLPIDVDLLSPVRKLIKNTKECCGCFKSGR